MKINGNIYSLPINFSFKIFMTNKEILDKSSISIDDSKWTWNDFKEIAQKVTASKTGITALPNVSYSDLLETMTHGNYEKFIDRQNKKSNFDSQEFVDLLNIVKSFGDGKLASKGAKQEMGAVMDAAQRGALVFFPNDINDYMFYGFFKNVFNGNLALLNYPSDGKGGSAEFSADYSYGINNRSEYKDKAWEFLKILLSDDIQSSRELGGFSVNMGSQQKKAQEAMEMTSNGNVKMMIKGGENSKPVSPAQITQTDIDYINKIIGNLKTYSNIDFNIEKIVQDETKAFFSGSKTAEEVAKLIQNRIDTYLGE
jgi:multiple sugar transport system substrate-binding protein